jgi:pimeloyl-ACP methyl ester carboxylesterase
MADDAITFIKGKNLKQVDLFGFSMGGMIAQKSCSRAERVPLAHPRLRGPHPEPLSQITQPAR